MAKWYGEIGFAETVETKPGVWVEQITKRNYYGDVTRDSRRLQTADKLNDNINISNQISIISDPYANENFHSMRYAFYMGTRWKITDIEVQYPRLNLTLGGIWNGESS